MNMNPLETTNSFLKPSVGNNLTNKSGEFPDLNFELKNFPSARMTAVRQ